MTVKREIERQEQEFKELLGRVMRDPLAPVHEAVTTLGARVEQLETALQEMREVELGALGLHVEEMGTQVRQMKSKTGETPRDVRLAVEPVLQRLQAEVEGARLATQALIREEAQRADDAAQRLGAQLTDVAVTVSESRTTLQTTLQGNTAQIEGALKSLSVEAEAQAQHVVADLGGVARQVEAHQQEFARLQDALDGAVARLCEQSAGERTQAEQRIADLTSALAQVQAMCDRQSEQLAALKQQQDAIPERLDEQLRGAARRMGWWLLAGAGMLCLGCTGAALLVMQRV